MLAALPVDDEYDLACRCVDCDVDPRAWLADVLARIADHPANRIADLLPWNWRNPLTSAILLIRRSVLLRVKGHISASN
jgi:hypothetical protein